MALRRIAIMLCLVLAALCSAAGAADSITDAEARSLMQWEYGAERALQSAWLDRILM